MKKIQVNSPEYRALVSGLLGKEAKFESVPQITQKEKEVVVPKLAPKKAAKKKVEKKKEEKIYLLFNTTEFGNSDDPAYELDYAFRGAYRSEHAALKAAASSIVELENELENAFFDSETEELLDNVKDTLLERGWKVVSTNIE